MVKKWLILAVAAVAVLSRLPHPARDVGKLDPVQALYLYIENGQYRIVTDIGAEGTGRTLPDAARELMACADREIFLDTAEYLYIPPDLPVPAELYDLLRPDTKILHTRGKPDLTQTANLAPSGTLARLRAEQAFNRKG